MKVHNLKSMLNRMLNYSVTSRTEPLLREIYDSGFVFDSEGNKIKANFSVTVEQGERLYSLVRDVKPKVTLEVGLCYGISALYICRALKEVGGLRHIAMDPFQSTSFRSIGLLNLQRAGYGELVELHEERSDRCLPKLLYDGVRVDFAFIDGWHTFDYTLVDFFFVHQLLTEGGVVVFHDCQMPAIRRVVRFVLSHRDYEKLPWKRSWRRHLYQGLVDVGVIVGLLVKRQNPFRYRSPGVQMVALRKRSDYEPSWNFYRSF